MLAREENEENLCIICVETGSLFMAISGYQCRQFFVGPFIYNPLEIYPFSIFHSPFVAFQGCHGGLSCIHLELCLMLSVVVVSMAV